MNAGELLSRFRTEVADTQLPYLWSDEEILAYIDAAQNQFCRLAGGILDSTSALTQVAVTISDAWVSISPRILAIRRIQRLSDYAPVDPISLEDFERMGDDDYGTARRYRLDASEGLVRYAVVNMATDALRLVPIPAAAETLDMTVYRLPLAAVSVDTIDTALEIAAHHQEYLLWWMKHLAYSKQDAETRDDRKAQTFDGKFRAYCEQARQERERREHKPRAVAYGGI